MTKKAHEIMGIPTEFHEDGVSEYPPLPDEFNRFPKASSAEEETESQTTRLQKVMLLLGTAGLTTLGILFPGLSALSGTAQATASPPPATVVSTVTAAPSSTAGGFTPIPTVQPAALPTSTALPTNEVFEIPDVRMTFFRTSEVYHGQVQWIGSERIKSVLVRMWDTILEDTVWEYALTPEEIETGFYAFSDYDLFAGEFVQEHWTEVQAVDYELDPVLEVVYTYQNADGASVTVTDRSEAAYELWVNTRFDLADPTEDFLSYSIGEITYPDSFVVRIDPTPFAGLRIVYGENQPLQPGEIAVTLTVNGQEIQAENCRLVISEEDDNGTVFYSYAFVMPRPESFPEHGTAQVKLVQQLLHFDLAITKTREIDY